MNPDGLEWRRTKWAAPVRRYLKFAEKKMVQYADLIISDNKGIKAYLTEEYGHIDSVVIAYGTETDVSSMTHSPTLQRFAVQDYFLIVGRFVPENNYELLIRSFMASKTEKDLVIITNYEGNTFYEDLRKKTYFDQDKRIKFVGTVYDQNELRYIREHATAYLHGHEVGGTNPGLLEAMWSTAVNLVLDVNFNRETAGDSVLYFSKDELEEKINQISDLEDTERKELQKKSRNMIQERYMWDMICTQYEELFVES